MPKAILDMERCQPESCDQGLCSARRKCPVKALWQEEPFAVPFINSGRCHGCSKCLVACPLRAILLN